jgi:hypothetical protein
MRSIITLLPNILIIWLWIVLNTIPALAMLSDISQQEQVSPVLFPIISTKGEEFWRAVEFGPELVNNRLGLRLAGNGNWYAPNGFWGLRLDAGLVQNELRHDMAKLFLSIGTKPEEVSQLIFSAGWLQRYAWEKFPKINEQGHHQDQYMMGGEYRRELLALRSGLNPSVSASLSSAYCQAKSVAFPTIWCKVYPPKQYKTFIDTSRDCYAYGLGGGSRFEGLAGFELGWQAVELSLRAGIRHRIWEKWGFILHHHSFYPGESDAPRAIVQLTWRDLLGCELNPYYSWEPDLQVLGGAILRSITPQLSLVARAEVVKGRGLSDDTHYFCGLQYSFGTQSNPSSKSDWLTPVYGADNEYLAPHLRQPCWNTWNEGESDFTQSKR